MRPSYSLDTDGQPGLSVFCVTLRFSQLPLHIDKILEWITEERRVLCLLFIRKDIIETHVLELHGVPMALLWVCLTPVSLCVLAQKVFESTF